MKLISMTDFILSDEWTTLDEGNFIRVIEYAKFLKQPLKLEMFVPCDEEGNILEKPIFIYTAENIKKLKGVEIEIAKLANKRAEQYTLAKKRCLFKGFSNADIRKNVWFFIYKEVSYFIPKNDDIEGFMQNFVPDEIELTETAMKQFNL